MGKKRGFRKGVPLKIEIEDRNRRTGEVKNVEISLSGRTPKEVQAKMKNYGVEISMSQAKRLIKTRQLNLGVETILPASQAIYKMAKAQREHNEPK